MDKSSSSYHCGSCRTNWPYEDDYKRCPYCLIPTAKIFTLAVLSVSEAKSLIRKMAFDDYYTLEVLSAHNREIFEAIIDGAGFTDEEKSAIKSLHDRLPEAHLSS